MDQNIDWAAEASKYGGTVTPADQTDWAAEAAKYGGTVTPATPSLDYQSETTPIADDGIISRLGRYIKKNFFGYAKAGLAGGPAGLIAHASIVHPSVGTNIAKATVEPFVKTAATGASAIAATGALAQNAIFPNLQTGQAQADELLNKGISTPGYGNVKPIGANVGMDASGQMSTKPSEQFTSGKGLYDFGQMIGTGLQVGTTLGAGELSSAVPKVGIAAAAKVGGIVGSVTGGLYGAGTGLRNEKATRGSVAVDTLGGAFIGGLLGAGIAGLNAEPTAAEDKWLTDLRSKFSLTKKDPQIETLLNENVSPKARAQVQADLDSYIKDAKEAVKNPRADTPLQKAADKGMDALKVYQDKLDELRVQKEAALSAVGEDDFEGYDKFIGNLNKDLQSKLGVNFNADGEMRSVSGRVSRIGMSKTDQGTLQNVYKYLSQINDSPTIQEVDDVIDGVQNELYKRAQLGAEPLNTRAEGILKSALHDLNDSLKTQVGGDYGTVNTQMADMIDRKETLSKLLGEEAVKGGALMKRVFSPSDAGTKRLFEGVRQDTGVDLVKEASLAKFAMETVGDARQRQILEQLSIPLLTSHLKQRALMIALGAIGLPAAGVIAKTVIH